MPAKEVEPTIAKLAKRYAKNKLPDKKADKFVDTEAKFREEVQASYEAGDPGIHQITRAIVKNIPLFQDSTESEEYDDLLANLALHNYDIIHKKPHRSNSTPEMNAGQTGGKIGKQGDGVAPGVSPAASEWKDYTKEVLASSGPDAWNRVRTSPEDIASGKYGVTIKVTPEKAVNLEGMLVDLGILNEGETLAGYIAIHPEEKLDMADQDRKDPLEINERAPYWVDGRNGEIPTIHLSRVPCLDKTAQASVDYFLPGKLHEFGQLSVVVALPLPNTEPTAA